MKELKWQTIKEYVDGETGEVLTEAQVAKEYEIINKIKKTKFNETDNKKWGFVTITNICRKSIQGKLF